MILTAASAGFCYGVSRAVKLAEDAAREGPCVTLCELIHNKREVARLEALGVSCASSVDDIPDGSRVVIRSHGASPEEYARLEAKGCTVVDATCPDVAKTHEYAAELSREGRRVIIIGTADHPEVRVTCAWCSDPVVVFDEEEAARRLPELIPDPDTPVGVICQTTGMEERVKKCEEFIKKQYTNVKLFDTICKATSRRQEEAERLAKSSDVMIVIGGKNSANTLELTNICKKHCPRVYLVESAEELPLSELRKNDVIGVTAGASAPAWIIKEVRDKMNDEMKEMETMTPEAAPVAEEPAPVAEEPVPVAEETAPAAEPAPVEDESALTFDQLLEQNLKTLHNGDKVTGIVQSISTTEVSVDLGTKHSGYIPISELTDEPDVKPEDIVQIGGTIETYVVRVNDVEGTVMLSKKRLDTVKNWEMIEQAREDRSVVEGVVTEVNKGGVVVSVKGIRVFVPASQSGMPKDADLNEMLKTRQKLRITEVNHSRRRVVGSIRAVQYDLRRAAAEQTWAEIEVGKKYTGTVKSLTSYGAFIDIGGVDGMAHVSELSWKRIRHPSEVLAVGDQVEVYVINFDKETKKISLGVRKPEDNPWVKFTSAHQIGDVINVKIVKLMQFGAFAEILPGVDGLIHVSQITSERRIGKPDEVLSEGQEVDVKITNIDYDKKKVSLSIRALEAAPAPVEEKEAEDEVVYDTETDKPEPEEAEAPAEE
ncbi:MAG: bifunctional 4-hydroxy-3-methylbut-2-enyl diphosphate reductase/30S ribosomal protein S1 [Oscillospiraceae bacterium]|nr:bifunctional 4-hydroxy-3-methylbut-2-enyl diphosphate reductase/30S ribosomal protein S1 [Oscillospiraceae bacterium]